MQVLSKRAVGSLIVALAMGAAWSQAACAGEYSLTDAEQLYRQTRKSSDRSTQLLGQRWYGLVKRQKWTDATGKFTTTARYVEHDPDEKWVKLRVERNVNGQREYKDLTVPVEKLSKACQSRVRQIAFLEPKVREAAVAAEQEAEEKENDRQNERGGEGPRSDRPDMDDGRHDQAAAEPAPPESWATSYEAFRANFTVQPQGGGYQVNWGTLVGLQMVHDALYGADGKARTPGPLQAAVLGAQLAALGEFSWEARLTEPPADDTDWADRLDLPPLPAPLSLELVLDSNSGDWQRLRPGSRVHLTGHFVAFAGQYKIVAAIRFPDRSRTRRSTRPDSR